ncbi:MAG: enoyl-CoA hydratase/isomerase family protein [Rhodospirillaceae bacterium]|nr:enoyl-CoA hydratase/isomerase family protein [Rhodospirillaceae bacterium]
MPQFITVENRDAVTILTLNRPDLRNALSQALRLEVIDALATFNADDNQRALVITGAGDRAFCAGQDLKEAESLNEHNAAEWQDQLRAYLDAFRQLDKPAIAAINGAATGAGFYTALLCDIRIAHANIRMGQPEINVGFPSIIGTRLMYMTLGHSVTTELSLSGRLLSGADAFQRDLVTELVEPENVMPRALAWATELAQKPPLAMNLTKQALREYTQDVFDGAIDTGKRLQPQAFASGEPQRVVAEFLARKKTAN